MEKKLNKKQEFEGNEEYSIDTTGDCVVGDEVAFERTVFFGKCWGRHAKPKFQGFEFVTGRIVKDSYGAAKQQHTFTLELPSGDKTLIKGRNLYRNKDLPSATGP